MQIAHLLVYRLILRREVRRSLIAGFYLALSLCVSNRASAGKSPGSPPLPGFDVLDLRKSQGVDLRPLEKRRQILWVDLHVSESLRLNFEQKGFDIAVEVFAPSGELLFKVDGLNGDWGPELMPLLGEQSGRYRVEITGTGAGTYRFSAEPRRKARDRDRQCTWAARAYFQGRQLAKANKTSQAVRNFQDSVQFWQVCAYSPGEADAAYQLGKSQAASYRSKEALKAFLRSLTIYRKLKFKRLQALVLNDLGLTYVALGQPDSALVAYQESLAISQRFGFRDRQTDVFLNRARLRMDLGEWRLALQDAEAALPLAASLGKLTTQVKLENLKGRIYRLLGDPDEALRYHRKALALLQGNPNTNLLASTLVHFGDDYRDLHNWSQAIANYSKGITLWRQLGDPGEEATALNNLGLVYSQTGHWEAGRDVYRRVREIDQQLGNQAGAAVASLNLAWILASMGRFGEALRLYRDSLAVVQGQGRRPDEAVAYFGMAWTERKRGNLNEARRLLEKALALVESIRAKSERQSMKARFLVGWQDFYALMVDILMEQHRREPVKGFDLQAFETSEKARCRTLLDSVEGRIVLPSLSSVDLQKVLDQDTILLEYFLGDQKSFLWVVTSDSFTSYVLPEKAKIEALGREVHRQLAYSHQLKNRRTAVRKASELSQILLGQVAKRLDRKRLLIVAPPELQYVSFAALPELPVAISNDGKWPTTWLHRFEIMAEPSATFLASLRRLRKGRQPPPDLLALVADPAISSADGENRSEGVRLPGAAPSFSRLRYSRKEAVAIASQAKGQAVYFLGPEANRSLVLQGGLRSFRTLHFSAHGISVSDNPENSAIVLSNTDRNGNAIESRLLAHEIAKLDLPADLVVLSACSTGLGTEVRGEGLVGLTQAFFSAGASSVAASLWNVDDLGTAELMRKFYYNLLQKNLSPSASLRAAQLEMWRQERWTPPYYWAGFVLQGEWR